jgi:predicted DNA-binding transcriptional regulator AlpA
MSKIKRNAVEDHLDETRRALLSSVATPPAQQEQHDDDKSQDHQTPPSRPRGRPRRDVASSISPTTTIHRRQSDRGSGDDAAAPRLTVYVRFVDLVAAGIVRNWETLFRLIDRDGFPHGVMLGRNTRAWTLDEVEAWLATRPTARKVITLPKTRNSRQHDEVA